MKNVAKWLMKEKFSPSVAELHITNKCNLNCKTCWRHNQEPDYSKEMYSEKWVNIVKQAIYLDVKEFYISGGGEPMSRHELTMNIMQLIKKNNLNGVMTTNCTLFNEEDIKKMILLGWDYLQVSIDGPDKETQNFLRGEDVYEKNIRILKLFNKWKKKLKKEKPHISFHTVLSNKNHRKLRGIISLAARLKIKEVNLQPLVMQSQYCKEFTLNPEQEAELQIGLRNASELAKKKNITINFEKFLKKGESDNPSYEKKIRCFEPWSRITILNDGLVKTCCNPSRIHESVHKRSLEEIWRSRRFDKVRKKFYKGKLMKECCTHPNKRL